MKTKLINSNQEFHRGYGAGSGDVECYEYECPCGKGIIREEHDNIPGFREHYIHIECNECNDKYTIDTSNGVRNWAIIEKTNEEK